MALYRIRETGEVVTQGVVRQRNPNVSVPKVWTDETCDMLGVDEVHDPETNPPDPAQYQRIVMDGAVQDAGGVWRKNFIVVNLFEDDEEGTRVEKEQAYQARLDEDQARNYRGVRDELLAATDWVVLYHTEKGTNIPANMETYRQALRDLPTHANWPNLEDGDWPTKP
jgi:hypothetical protein